MKNNEKIINIVKDYSNDYNLSYRLKKMVLDNNSDRLNVKIQIETGNKNKENIKINFDVCVIENGEEIEEITSYTAKGINVFINCKYNKYKGFEEYELYGGYSSVTLTNEKNEKLKMFIDYKKNICGYTSNIKGLALKQFYKPNNGSSLESYLSEKYIRVTSFIFAPRDFEDLEKELKNVEKHVHNDLTGEIIVNDWEEYEPSPDDNMDFLKNISSGRNCLYLDEK